MTTDFYVEKQSGTFSDALIAFGLARLLRLLLHKCYGGDISVRLSDAGAYYRLSCAEPLSREFLQGFTDTLAPIPFLHTQSKPKEGDSGEPAEESLANILRLARQIGYEVVDFEAERDKHNLWQKQREESLKGTPQDVQAAEPSRDWYVYQALRDPNVLKGYNKAVGLWISAHAVHSALVSLLCDLFSTLPNDVKRAERAWQELARHNGLETKSRLTALQFYNPERGKGQNAPKANRLRSENVESFWLLEFLKMVGFYEAGVSLSQRDREDRKTYVLMPVEIDSGQSSQIMAEFRQNLDHHGSIVSDVMAVLRYVETLLKYSEKSPSLRAFLFGKPSLRDIVAGFQVAFYKSMGNSHVVMNLSFIGLPSWMRVQSEADALKLNSWIRELDQVTKSLNESLSDAVAPLTALRDFLSSGNLAHLFAFTTPYSGYCISRREDNKYASQLSTTLLEEMIMSIQPQYAAILQNQGFRNIAYAIRQSTVIAQYAKARGERRYDIRYGLGQELVRKSHRAEEFLTALADFVTKYNAENAQVAERDAAAGRQDAPRRRSVATSDLEQLVALVDQYGAALVANLLVAYGYASERKSESAPESDSESVSDSE